MHAFPALGHERPCTLPFWLLDACLCWDISWSWPSGRGEMGRGERLLGTLLIPAAHLAKEWGELGSG